MIYFALYFTVFLTGTVIGSFLNVCIYRIPQQEGIVLGRSHCMSCGSVLKWYELIPVFSFLAQRGRCRSCNVRLSWQYPAVELLNGILYLCIAARFGWTPKSALYCACASVCIVVAVIDQRTYQIPPGCNLIIGALGIVQLCLDYTNFIHYAAGFLAVSVLFAAIWLFTKGKGIGGGDVKLMAAAGLLLGWQKILAALAIGSIAGSVIHIGLMKWKGRGRVLAFGPYLAFGIVCAMLFGEAIVEWYLGQM